MSLKHVLWLLGAALICLKLTHAITIGWLFVLLPFFILPVLFLAFVAVCFVVAAAFGLIVGLLGGK